MINLFVDTSGLVGLLVSVELIEMASVTTELSNTEPYVAASVVFV